MVLRHTRMAPASIQSGTPPQQQWQRIFIPPNVMYKVPNGGPDIGIPEMENCITKVYVFDPDNVESVYFEIPVPLDWIAGTDAYAYPIFCTSINLYAQIRWGLAWLPMVKGISIAAVPNVIEGNFDADGTGVVIPPKSQWLTLKGSLLSAGEPAFKQDDFTLIADLSCKLYRAANSVFDTHPGEAYLLGLVVMYQAYI